MISQETIEGFRQAVKEEYGKDLTPEEASEILRGLVSYVDLLAKIDARDKQVSDVAGDPTT